ncbi:MAG: flippase-like domain-containing protein [Saprospiraceae bacterium]|nr:flippase-like domain-containing protein [Saprospiraceae bacterium]MBK8279051.1 flippase-like domain-containing protein [Saprospiraceae bacterium]MBK8512269.1 flippase-like domain-containing protein [Saprospiraceae bacterium]MBK9678831.1 flippase-like domain-containing protein [Saprospiraceae bacterium]MBK9930868.1 flippase-like domain-containing protein [Saprospiraceae bacterium]
MSTPEEDIDIEKEDEQTRSVMKSFKSSKIWLPIVIGLGVVVYKLFDHFDTSALKSITWSPHTAIWLFLACGFLLIRHVAYTWRLYYLVDGILSFWKCFKLIIIWEFSSAISPTSLGGSAVSVFVLSQEKIGASRTLATIIYTVILDSLFFLISVPILIFIFGVNVIHPSYTDWSSVSEVGYSLIFFYGLILVYGLLFAYGMFINPSQFKNILVFFTRFPFLKRFRIKAIKLGDEMILSAGEIVKRDWRFHLKSFGLTAAAWTCRFIIVNCLIIALIDVVSYHPWDQLKIYGRQVVMFVFMMFSPTPGAAGFAEVFFGNFIGDYIPKGAALIIALIWRFLTYYLYLLAGVIIIPSWLTGLIRQRRAAREVKNRSVDI